MSAHFVLAADSEFSTLRKSEGIRSGELVEMVFVAINFYPGCKSRARTKQRTKLRIGEDDDPSVCTSGLPTHPASAVRKSCANF